MSDVIDEKSQVTLHFSLKLEGGELVDSTFDKEAATFSMGDGSLLPGFEKHLHGLQAGDRQSFTIPKEEGFGAGNPQNIQRFKPSDFADDMELSEGLIFSFADGRGGELPGVVKTITDDEVMVDFNHPLAGREITFDVEIIAIN